MTGGNQPVIFIDGLLTLRRNKPKLWNRLHDNKVFIRYKNRGPSNASNNVLRLI